jgi:2-oxoisovalerate dehydrogenase E1 component
MQFNRKNYTNDILIDLYKSLLFPRMVEDKMLVLLRQNKISKWFSGIGQEAIAVGITKALEKDEWIFPMHRNLGVFTAREIPFEKLFAQWQGKLSGFSKGRERSFHFGTNEFHICGMISHMAANLSVADGVGLANLLENKGKATVAFCGDGATSEGDFHEAVNLAAVWSLPVIFVVENNGYALSTPNKEQFNCEHIIDKAPGYGIDALQIDGNNILEVYDTLVQLANNVRNNPRPVLVEALTFRMRGHEEASGTKYVPQDLLQKWELKDPLVNYEKYLIEEFVIDQSLIKEIKESYSDIIEQAIEQVENESEAYSDLEHELADIYKSYSFKKIEPADISHQKETRFIDAISQALEQSMERHENLVLMGQDIAEYGGVFKVTEGFLEKFGKDRVRNTPLCESAIIGAGLGLSIKGMKSVIEMQFADFVSCGFNQIVNNLAKSYYRWGQEANVVIRMPTGAGTGGGPFHSQSNEAWFFHVPGLKIVYPSNPMDAKGLLSEAINDPNPVLFFEHKALYRSLSQTIAMDYYTTEIGKSAIVREGEDITIVTYGMGVIWASEIASEHYISAQILDLRSLLPWDKEGVKKAVEKTGKVLVMTEDSLTGSIVSEIAAWIGEHCFSSLDAPVFRIGSLDTPVPFAKGLEEEYLPKKRLLGKINELLQF